MEKTTFNISEVSRLTGKARSTITNHLKNGKLSYVLDADGTKRIEASEIIRAYPDHLELGDDGKLKSKTKRIEKQTAGDTQESVHYQQLLERGQQERDRERKQYQETIEHLRSDLEKSQERETRATLLLEHQSKDTDRFVNQMADIESHIAKQETEARKLRKALIVEKNKTFWEKLFG